ncbi:MAG TPA: ABC transporter permease [Vicinamibacterales bacterium]|nr:ABC transporter permease [Vicinamibacterales bacterium]
MIADIRLALRLLARRPGFAAVTIATLALGIGAPTAIFSVVDAVLLRPLPYPEPDRVVQFRIEARGPAGPVGFDALPVETALEWAADSTTLAAVAIYDDRALTLSSTEGPFRLTGISATPNLFDLLGAAPEIGRTFDAAERDAHEIVLSHAMWARHFASSPSVLGSSITMDGEAYRVVGVMPEGFGFPTPEAAFWVPVVLEVGGTRGMVLPVVARLRPGATVAGVVQEGTDRLASAGGPGFPQTLVVRTLQDQMVGGVRRVLWVLLAAVGFVLVIATVNIALLLLTRGAGREREFSVRLALGAGRARLVRQLFVEGLVLGALGGVAGLLLARAGLSVLLELAPADIPRLQGAALNGEVLAFAVVLTAVTSLMFGVLSAGRTLAVDPIRALGGAGESRLAAVTGSPRRRLHLLAAGELALTMVLLVGAGLLLRSFVGLVLVDQGFDPHGALAFQVNLPLSRYPTPAARLAFDERLLEQLRQLHGARAIGLTTTMPNRQPSGRFQFSATAIASPPDPFTTPTAQVHMVSDGFIEAAGLHLLTGRTILASDGPGAEPVVVISEELARRQFPNRGAVGNLLYSGTGNRRVVGVVSDVRPAAPGADPGPTAYLPLRQNTEVLQWYGSPTIVVRGSDASSFAAPARALVLSLDSQMPPFNVRSLDEEVSQLVAGPRFSAALLAVFALVALIMAAVGVYGVMAYGAGLRTREVGVRVALGATRAQVLRLMLRDGLVVVSVGLVAGLIAALWLARTLTGMLHEVTPADPIALVSVAVILATVGMMAALVPARRATRVSALDALRSE